MGHGDTVLVCWLALRTPSELSRTSSGVTSRLMGWKSLVVRFAGCLAMRVCRAGPVACPCQPWPGHGGSRGKVVASESCSNPAAGSTRRR
jgi:hypothetical protein